MLTRKSISEQCNFRPIGRISRSGNSGVAVLGGVMLPSEWWSRISTDWQYVLDTPPVIPYYKASEVWSNKPGDPFTNLHPEERIAKVCALGSTLCNFSPAGFSCRMEWATFEQFKKQHSLAKPGNDPYFYLFYNAIRFLFLYAQRHGNFGTVEFWFDNQNKIGKNVLAWYSTFKSTCPPNMQTWLTGEPKFGDEKKVLPLQAADMYVWHNRREVLNSLGRSSDLSLWNLLSRYANTLEMGYQELQSMASDLGIIQS
jgi:hypothetical protein